MCQDIPCGELGDVFSRVAEENGREQEQTLNDFIRMRTGERLCHPEKAIIEPRRDNDLRAWTGRAVNFAARMYVRVATNLLPQAFREQNVSFASVGEKHQWLWDFHQLHSELTRAGFSEIERVTANSSSYHDFPCDQLDLNRDGSPRKGELSMYVEAKKAR